jgi:hypothetical protein
MPMTVPELRAACLAALERVTESRLAELYREVRAIEGRLDRPRTGPLQLPKTGPMATASKP